MPESLKGRMVEFKSETGRGHGYLATPKSSKGGILVLHAWWGLNDVFKSLCDRLAAEGYTAFAPDLHQGKVAKTIDEAKNLLSNTDEMKTFPPLVLGALDYLVSQPGLKSHRIGVVGFSMGASWALWISREKPSNVTAVVLFYGTYPDLDLSKSQASYLGHYASMDEWEPSEQVRLMEEKIKSAGRPVKFHSYPGTKHWFFEDNRPEYKPEESRLAWNRTLDFFRSSLG